MEEHCLYQQQQWQEGEGKEAIGGGGGGLEGEAQIHNGMSRRVRGIGFARGKNDTPYVCVLARVRV